LVSRLMDCRLLRLWVPAAVCRFHAPNALVRLRLLVRICRASSLPDACQRLLDCACLGFAPAAVSVTAAITFLPLLLPASAACGSCRLLPACADYLSPLPAWTWNLRRLGFRFCLLGSWFALLPPPGRLRLGLRALALPYLGRLPGFASCCLSFSAVCLLLQVATRARACWFGT